MSVGGYYSSYPGFLLCSSDIRWTQFVDSIGMKYRRYFTSTKFRNTFVNGLESKCNNT